MIVSFFHSRGIILGISIALKLAYILSSADYCICILETLVKHKDGVLCVP